MKTNSLTAVGFTARCSIVCFLLLGSAAWAQEAYPARTPAYQAATHQPAAYQPATDVRTADLPSAELSNPDLPAGLPSPERWLSPESLPSSIAMMIVVSLLSLAPAVLLMTTSFVRITIVLTLLRQALGAPQLPPNQVLTSISLFLTLVVMTPVWKVTYREGVQPYVERRATAEEAWRAGIGPIREFMILQIERTGNSDDLWLFLDNTSGAEQPQTYADVPLTALLPAFLLSEIKTAFLIGFQIYLPFLILDLVVASVLSSLGMMMVPPAAVSLPFKLLLFVLIDGWRLTAGMLLESFAR